MNINPELKGRAKTQRLQQLQLRYFELEMDKISVEANGGDEKEVEVVIKRMEAIRKAYEAVEAIPD